MKRIFFVSIVIALLLLPSCRSSTNCCRPIGAPSSWVSTESEGEVDLCWWESFEDDQLTHYIELASENNKDVRAAMANVCQARAVRLTVTSQLYPDIDAELRYNRNSFNTFFGGAGNANPGNIASVTTNFQQEIFFVGLDAIWEIDIFGRTRKQVEAACYRVGSAVEAYHGALLSVFAETATNYFNARGYQELIAQKEEKIKTLEEILDLRKKLETTGIANSIDILDLEASLSSLKSELPQLVAEMFTAIYRLSILIGEFPGVLLEEMEAPKPLPSLPVLVEAGLPSELLERRPDIRQAEAELGAATADVGVAVRDLFPRFFLAGSVGHQKFTLPTQLFDNFVWSYTADILTPVFKGGRLRANIRAEEAKAMARFYQYEQTILQAVEEAESRIVGYTQEVDRTSNLESSLSDVSDAFALTEALYLSGIADAPGVLNKKLNVISAKEVVTESKLEAFNKLISLYKSLGGGWDIPCY